MKRKLSLILTVMMLFSCIFTNAEEVIDETADVSMTITEESAEVTEEDLPVQELSEEDLIQDQAENTIESATQEEQPAAEEEQPAAEEEQPAAEEEQPAAEEEKAEETTEFAAESAETVQVSGRQVWYDSNDQDGIRPDHVVVWLVKNGEKQQSYTTSAANDWQYSFGEQPLMEDGEAIEWTVMEETPAGYTTVVSGFDLYSAHDVLTVDLKITVSFSDAGNQDGKRPESVQIKLLGNGSWNRTAEVQANGDAVGFTFSGMNRNIGGNEVDYTVDPEEVEGYTVSVDTTFGMDFDITDGELVGGSLYYANEYEIIYTHIPEKTEVNGSITWQDQQDQDGLRPSAVMINLLKNGTVIDTCEASAANDWTYSFTGLQKYLAGEAITYSVQADETTGYAFTAAGDELIASHECEKTAISVSVIWDDAEDQDAKRPDALTANITLDGSSVATIALSPDAWQASSNELDLYRNGGELVPYQVSLEVPESYSAVQDGETFTLTHEPEMGEITGEVIFLDYEDEKGLRPIETTISLMANGTVIATAEASEAADWQYTFGSQPVYQAGEKIIYTVSQPTPAGYTTVVNGFEITNALTPEKISVSGTILWADDDDRDGIRPETVAVTLIKDGTSVDQTVVNTENGQSFSFELLDSTGSNGQYGYSVTVDAGEGYTAAYSSYLEIRMDVTDDEVKYYSGLMIKNEITLTHVPQTITVSGTKTWKDDDDRDGKRPETIVIELYADGDLIRSREIAASTTMNYTFNDLYRYRDQGVEIIYTVKETPVEGYDTAINGFDIINTYTIETQDIEGMITWNDEADYDGLRPHTLRVTLLADGEPIQTVHANADAGWTYHFEAQPVYRDHGEVIVYTIQPVVVNGYEAQVDGFDIAYRHQKISYTLTIRYIYDTDGTIAAEKYVGTYYKGETYQIESPAIRDHITQSTMVEGTMPSYHVEITVIYRRYNNTEILINDLQTALGIGGSAINRGDCYE